MKKAIIIGASSGIGRALANTLTKEGYIVGIVARRLSLLMEIQQENGKQIFIKQIDVSIPQDAIPQLSEFIQEMGSIDLIINCAGIGYINPNLDWNKENETIEVNVVGFAAIANVAIQYLIKKGTGHLVNISSIAALRGSGIAPAYNASKAFESNYLAGLRQKIVRLHLPITITDIQPGFVDTAMAQGENKIWVASPEEAAKQIFQTIRWKKKHAYITKRWQLIALLFKFVPDYIYDRL